MEVPIVTQSNRLARRQNAKEGRSDAASLLLAGFEESSLLCGHSGLGRAAQQGIDGGTSLTASLGHEVGIHTTRLADVFTGETWAALLAAIPRRRSGACVPDTCTPNEDSCQPSPDIMTACNPDQDGSDCSPAETEACEPAY
ncbi:hypothetical protein ACIBAG_25925 [Streptomyces sp. NPDC051243]|uniref:hypothetical protein n=1 Tax=Streptomyces sp. NPDC051243 TaxID=3365646 RepID=UPI00378BA98C